MATSSTVRTVTTVQQQGSTNLDNNLDALLEDLQTSVSRPSSSLAMNGVTTPGGSRTYREVTTRTVQHEGGPGYQVQYLSAANPTTVVAERASSPGVGLLQQQPGGGNSGMTAYKTVSYQYNTSSSNASTLPASYQYNTASSSASSQPISGLLVDGNSVTAASDPTSDARLQQNLNELDSLLVDLHQAQKTGFGTDQGSAPGGVVTTRTVETSSLDPIDHSTPAQRQLQQVTRIVQQQRTYVDGGGSSPSTIRYQTEAVSPSTVRYQTEPASPRLQPKRSSSAQRELTYGTVETQHRTRSPSPMRHPDPSPRVPQRTVVQKDAYYETKSNTTPKPDRYRDKSPSNRRLQKEMYYETSKSSTQIPPSPQHDRYRNPSPPVQRRGVSPMRPVNQNLPDPYPGQPGGANKVTTIHTYNYSTTGGSAPSPVPPIPRSGAASPSPISRSPYPDHGTPILDLTPSPSPGIPYNSSPQPVPGGTKVTTTVRTYTYEHPGQPGSQPYPPGSGQPYPPGTTQPYPPGSTQPYPPGSTQPYSPGSTQPYPPGSPQMYPPSQPYPPAEPPSERTLTYHVSPREKEPLIEPSPPPTVITYKYSSHSSHSTSSKFPTQPEEQQPLLPRPFPTPSPTPITNVNGEPPKKLDELMASFSETELHPNHYPEPKATHLTPQQPTYPEGSNGVAIVTPTPNAKAAAAASASAAASAKAAAKDRQKTKNVAGPPVYYPPGVELFARKEEAMMQASGKKASGRYEYEYAKESKSKSSSSGGAAVVPVCLPLCCAMPCVIM